MQREADESRICSTDLLKYVDTDISNTREKFNAVSIMEVLQGKGAGMLQGVLKDELTIGWSVGGGRSGVRGRGGGGRGGKC